MAATTKRASKRARWDGLKRREALTGYLWIAPWLIGFIVFTVGPVFASLYISMMHFNFGSTSRFIGLENYTSALTADPLFWSSLLRTAYYTVLVVSLGVVSSLLAAVLLNQGLRGTSIYRTMFFLPSLVPIVATATLWAWILAADIGPLSSVFTFFAVRSPRWFAQAEWAIPAIAIIVLWTSVGGGRMITFLAGLQGVPQEYYDAAAMDGANTWQRFWNVTLPLLSPVVFFNVVLGIIGSFQVFEVAYVATQGGPGEATYFYALHVYNKAFKEYDFGYAAALAWLLFLVLFVFTQVQFRTATRWVYYEGERK